MPVLVTFHKGNLNKRQVIFQTASKQIAKA
jgi:hypothetical protein